MKVFVTKYALTQGILEKEAEKVSFSNTMISCCTDFFVEHYHKPYWHKRKEDAIAHANEMRQKKILELQKQINKLEKLKFINSKTK